MVSEDDVLDSVGGILDVLDNYAFVRTRGYLPGPDDAYVSLSMVKKFGLRKGDVITGVHPGHHSDGDRQGEVQPARPRSTRSTAATPRPSNNRHRSSRKLTPLYPQERLRLETDADQWPDGSSTCLRRSARASAA